MRRLTNLQVLRRNRNLILALNIKAILNKVTLVQSLSTVPNLSTVVHHIARTILAGPGRTMMQRFHNLSVNRFRALVLIYQPLKSKRTVNRNLSPHIRFRRNRLRNTNTSNSIKTRQLRVLRHANINKFSTTARLHTVNTSMTRRLRALKRLVQFINYNIRREVQRHNQVINSHRRLDTPLSRISIVIIRGTKRVNSNGRRFLRSLSLFRANF